MAIYVSEGKVRSLLDGLCVDWGFCIPSADANRLTGLTQLEAEQFARDVLLAEGMDPDLERRWLVALESRFVEYLGSRCVRIQS